MSSCRALVAGFGVPTQRDLDFGRQVIRYLEPFRWPEGVVVEDLSYTAHLALHRLQELQPPKLVLVGAFPRGTGHPGEVRLRRIAPVAQGSEDIHRALVESAMGAVDLNHTLGVLRHWGALPADTALIEVEPDDCSFGLGFSDALSACLDEILDLIRDEVGAVPHLDLDDALVEPASPGITTTEPMAAVASLAGYAAARREARFHERHRATAPVSPRTDLPGIEVVARTQAWGIGLDSGSDWFDVLPLNDDLLAVVIGEAPGRGVDAAALKSDLRVVAQAGALAAGESPADVVHVLDRWVTGVGRGTGATVAVLFLQPRTGRLRMCSAGHCPPLVVATHAGRPPIARYLHDDFTPALGQQRSRHRSEEVTRLDPGDTLLLFTDGLVEQPNKPLAFGLLELREAAATGPEKLDELCSHLVATCVDRRRREDDLSIVGLRLTP